MTIGRGLPAVVAVLAVAPFAHAGEEGEAFTITGSSTVRGWTCEVPVHEERLSADGPADAVVAGTSAVSHVEITIPVAAIECGNGKMNNHLRKALQAEEHPDITYTLSSYDLVAAANVATGTAEGPAVEGATAEDATAATEIPAAGAIGREATATVAGILTIAGESRPVELEVRVASAEGALHVVGEREIDMTEWGVKPPSLMLGAMKVGREVTIAFDLTLRP